MILKLFKAVWFLSLLGFMLIFLYIYASFPVNIVLGEGVEPVSTSRDVIFYSTLIFVSLVNALVFVVRKLYSKRDERFSIWFFGQIILLNFFFCTVLGFINLLNSGEKFAFENLGIIIYGSIVLIVLWALAWPIFLLSQKFMGKQAI